MLKTKNKLLLFLLIVVFLAIFISKRNNYKSKQNIYKYHHISLTFEEIVSKMFLTKKFLTKKEIDEELKEQLVFSSDDNLFEKLNYNLMYKNDSIYIYEFGFDNVDDKMSNQYLPYDISFVRSIFIKGDVLIYKQKTGVSHDLKITGFNCLLNDTLPKPPLPIHQRVIDSIQREYSIKSLGFINSHKK